MNESATAQTVCAHNRSSTTESNNRYQSFRRDNQLRFFFFSSTTGATTRATTSGLPLPTTSSTSTRPDPGVGSAKWKLLTPLVSFSRDDMSMWSTALLSSPSPVDELDAVAADRVEDDEEREEA